MCLSAPWLDHTRLQVVSPRISLKRTPFLSNRCSSTDREWRRVKEKDKATFFSHTNEWCFPAPSVIKPEEREFVVDSGPSMHMLSWKGLNSAELMSESPTTVVAANGEVQTKEEATVYVKELDLFVTVKLLEDTPAVLSLGKLCDDHGYSYEWTSGQKPQLIKNGRRIEKKQHGELRTDRCQKLFKLSYTYISNISKVVIPTLHPASTRIESTRSTVRGHPSHEPARTKKTNKNGDNETVRWHPLRDLPEWLEEFTENLVDENVPAHRDAPATSSRESASEPRGKVVSGKHCIYTHFPKDRNCDICMRTKRTKQGLLAENALAQPYLGQKKFGELMTADHKVLREGCESRNNHRYAVVVQIFASQWIQSYPCKTITFQETEKSLQKFLEPMRKPKVIHTNNSWAFGKACEDLSWNHCTSTHRSETNGIAERALRRIKEGTSAVLLQSGLDERWWAGFMECHWYLRNIQDLLSDWKTPYNRRFGEPFKGPVIPFGSMVEFHPFSAKDLSRLHQFGKKVLPGIFLGYVLYAEGIWRGDILVADIEELGKDGRIRNPCQETQC